MQKIWFAQLGLVRIFYPSSEEKVMDRSQVASVCAFQLLLIIPSFLSFHMYLTGVDAGHRQHSSI